MDTITKEGLVAFLGEYVSEHKKNLFDKVLSKRTRHFTVVLEDIFKPHNASAVIRTADCMGIQDIHVIENENAFVINPYVTRGATKWLDLHQYNEKGLDNSSKCLSKLKKQGYKIWATSPKKGYKPEEVPIDEKIALVFGTEFSGISSCVEEYADNFVNIPMHGFTESYNISVSAAICMYNIMNNIHESSVDWKLTEDEKNSIKLEWFRSVAPRSTDLEKQFMNQYSNEKI